MIFPIGYRRQRFSYYGANTPKASLSTVLTGISILCIPLLITIMVILLK